ncbi:MAG: Gfo/Idh/MocA family oxidoreductase [Planctomycetota bacterium]
MSEVLLLALNWRDTSELGAMQGTAIGLPLEFVYMSSGLSARGIEHTFVDAWLHDLTLPELAEQVAQARLIVICSAPSYLFWRDGITNIQLTSRALRELRAANPAAALALTGPHGTVDPEGFRALDLDYLLRGEPDETLPELAARLLAGEDTAAIPGVLHLRGGAVAQGCAVEVRDLGALPPLDLSRFDLAAYPFPPASGPERLIAGKVATLYEASRGCPYACIYCFKIGFRDKYRVKPIARIDAELADLAARGVGYVYLIDEIFFLKRKWALEVLPLFRKHGVAWGCQTRASCLVPEVVDAALATGCCGLVQIGLEHTDSEVLAAIGKQETDVAALAQALGRLTAGGVKVQLFLVSGLPGDSPEKHRELARSLAAFPMEAVDCIVHPAMPFPGTKLWEQGVTQGHPLRSWDDVERAAGLIGSAFSDRAEVERETFRLAGRVRLVSDRARIGERLAARRPPRAGDVARLVKHQLDVAAPALMQRVTRAREELRGRALFSPRARQGRHVLVGPGAIAAAHALSLSGRGEPIGFVGRSRARAQDAAQRWPNARAWGSLAEALEDPEVHSVIVCSPPHAHEAAAVAAIAAGKHLLLEKPVAHTLASARRIERAHRGQPAGGRGVALVAEQMRHLPFARLARRLLGADLGACGYAFSELRTSRPTGWRLDPGRSGGGVMLDVGVHFVALAKQLFGPARRVALRTLRRDPSGLACEEELELEHESGARGRILVAWGAASAEAALEITAPGGPLRYRLDERFAWRGARPHLVGLRARNGRLQLVDGYLAAIARGDAGGADLQEAIDDMQLALGGKGRARPLPVVVA